MKKLLLINLAILLSLVGFGQGTFPVPTGKGSIEASAFRQRVIDSSGTYYPNVAAHEIDERTSYGLDPLLEYIPAAVETSVAFSQKPIDGTGDFTVARAGIKTRVNEDGYLEEIAANIAAIDYTTGIPALKTEKAATNLLTQSNAFGNSYWTKSGASIEGDASTAGSELVTNGTFTGASTGWALGGTATYNANAIDFTGDGTNNNVITQTGIAGAADKLYLISYEVTANTLTGGGASLRLFAGSDGVIADNGVIASTVATHSFYGVSKSSGTNSEFVIGTNSSATGGSITLDNVSITEVTGYSSPSVDYPTDGYKLVEDLDVGQSHRVERGEEITNATTYTYSIIAKAGERTWTRIAAAANGQADAYFDLENGVVGTVALGTAKIESLVNGWYRCSITGTSNGTSLVLRYFTATEDGTTTYNGDGTSGVYIYGAQVEESSYPTSPIYTSGATASRIADAVTGAGNAATFNSVEGVLLYDGALLANDLVGKTISLTDGTSSNRVYLYYVTNTNAWRAFVGVGGATQANMSYTVTDITTNHKVAIRWKVNDFSLWIDGVEIDTDTSGISFPASTLTTLSLSNEAGAEIFYGNTNTVAVYNYLTDAEMANLTTP